MQFGRSVQNPLARRGLPGDHGAQQGARVGFGLEAGLAIESEIRGKARLELQSEAFPHDANAIDGIDNRGGRRGKDVKPVSDLNHRFLAYREPAEAGISPSQAWA